ncbi:MAG: hypothetical protein GXP40_11730 [Chloroflexi bacterium]|nr:hypothetical protein [Chloroflexota bacterium]
MKRTLFVLACLLLASLACLGQGTVVPPTPTPSPSRHASLPAGAVKSTPADDAWPPIAGPGWSPPAPLEGPVNTPGGEDSPFIAPDGETFYFFFTPDVNIPAEKQLLDGVTGIWMAGRSGDGWGEPQRVALAPPGELHLDGCPFVLGSQMIFCTIRESSGGMALYEAVWQNDTWTDWHAWEEIDQDYQVGEMHITADGQELYFASKRPGGLGGFDLWVSPRTGDTWGEPVNLGATVNTSGDENRPFVSADGAELWFDAASRAGKPGPAVYRALRQPDGSWGQAEEVISQFAGEPNLSADGQTMYFVHHYFTPDMSRMLEADIYVTQRLAP